MAPRWRPGLCQACRKSVCCRCGGAKDPARKNRRCSACHALEREAGLAKEDRACRCGRPLFERRDQICRICRREYYEARAARLAAEGVRVCSRCQQSLPAGWKHKTCTQCQTKARRRYPQRGATLPGICRHCGQAASAALCRRCQALVNVWGEGRVNQESLALG